MATPNDYKQAAMNRGRNGDDNQPSDLFDF